jgi:hypothetical protein
VNKPENGSFFNNLIVMMRTENRLRMRADSWLNSNAWDSKIDLEIWSGTDHSFNPIPDVYRLPCPSDDVFVASKYSARINIEYPINPIVINSLSVGSGRVPRSSLPRMLYSSLVFLTSSVRIDYRLSYKFKNNHPQSVDPNCSNMLSILFKQVCVHSAVVCPTNFSCSHPVKPSGFCCPLCAELIKVRFRSESSAPDYRSMATLISNLQADQHEHVRYFVHNVTALNYEVIIVHQDSLSAHHFASDVYGHLQKG